MTILQKITWSLSTRNFWKIHHVTKRFIESGVYISKGQDIFQNLALEDWIYEHVSLDNKSILLLWQNQPCVVIGRHQNPWTEVNLELLRQKGVPLARRRSGGGTVYHDLGNLNCTFFTTKKRYDREPNLELVAKAITGAWNLNVKVNERHDILLNEKYKISGTAAKLGKKTAYHHFTLLVDVDKDSLTGLLNTPLGDFSTTATESVKSEVMNLKDVEPNLSHDELKRVISEEYYQSVLGLPTMQPVYLDPTEEDMFPGVGEICEDLKSWSWRYGWTPKFTLEKAFTINQQYLQDFIDNHASSTSLYDAGQSRLTIELGCNKGCIERVGLTSGEIEHIDRYGVVIEEKLKGVRFNYTDVEIRVRENNSRIVESGLNLGVCEWILSCVLSMTVKVL